MGWEELFAAISAPLCALIIALLVAARKKIEGTVVQVVGNGVTEKLEEIHGRLDKIEVGTWQNTERLQTLEEQMVGGTGQHFTPPNHLVDPQAGAIDVAAEAHSQHVVPGTMPEVPQ